jgi:hypothetical protein
MKTRYLINGFVCLLLFSLFQVRVYACGCSGIQPPCTYCLGGVWVHYGDCESNSDCSGCKTCSACICTDDDSKCSGCLQCSGGTCVDDDSKCSGCQKCSGGTCIDDDSKCSGCQKCSGGTCVDDDSKCSGCRKCSGGTCIDDNSKCESDECCNNGTCVTKCDPNGGDQCTYRSGWSSLCKIVNIDDPSCAAPDIEICEWAVVEGSGPGNNATCSSCSPGCTNSTYCVLLKPTKTCQDSLSIWPPFHDCKCKNIGGLVDSIEEGNRNVCK